MMAAAVPRKLPGKPRAAAEALREYNEHNAKERAVIPAPLWPFWAPDPDGYHRWRVQLSCGHIRESLTPGKDDLPLTGWKDRAYVSMANAVTVVLPDGHAPCREFGCWHESRPYRNITAWKTRRVNDYPTDPVEPPHGEDPELWPKMRHAEPHSIAIWEVELSCGHATTSQADLEWKPEDGISYRISSDDRDAMARRAEILAHPDFGEEFRRRFEQMLPHPHPDEQCEVCARDRVITAYEYIAPLVPPPPPRKAPDPRKALERRIRAAETEATRLRRELAALDNTGEG